MRFEPNKYYKHPSGCTIRTLVVANTTMWGDTLIAEVCDRGMHGLRPFGTDSDDYAENWEIATEEEWEVNFAD